MEGLDLDTAPAEPSAETTSKPGTMTVLGLLTGVALIFSYLVAFAAVNALVAAEVIARWPAGQDPRVKYFVISFVSLMGFFLLMYGMARYATRRQMQAMDEIEEEAESPAGA